MYRRQTLMPQLLTQRELARFRQRALFRPLTLPGWFGTLPTRPCQVEFEHHVQILAAHLCAPPNGMNRHNREWGRHPPRRVCPGFSTSPGDRSHPVTRSAHRAPAAIGTVSCPSMRKPPAPAKRGQHDFAGRLPPRRKVERRCCGSPCLGGPGHGQITTTGSMREPATKSCVEPCRIHDKKTAPVGGGPSHFKSGSRRRLFSGCRFRLCRLDVRADLVDFLAELVVIQLHPVDVGAPPSA